jgi:hypothetical protein
MAEVDNKARVTSRKIQGIKNNKAIRGKE